MDSFRLSRTDPGGFLFYRSGAGGVRRDLVLVADGGGRRPCLLGDPAHPRRPRPSCLERRERRARAEIPLPSRRHGGAGLRSGRNRSRRSRRPCRRGRVRDRRAGDDLFHCLRHRFRDLADDHPGRAVESGVGVPDRKSVV